jgi:hypothetical protein
VTDDEREADLREKAAYYTRQDPALTAGADLRFLLARLDAGRARAAALEKSLLEVQSEHADSCNEVERLGRWAAALEAGLRELAACWEGCDDPACRAGGGLCGRCLTREHAARQAARRLLGGQA